MEWRRHALRVLNKVARRLLRVGLLGAGSHTPRSEENRECRRVLLVKLVGMGDAVMVRSLANHLHHQLPDLGIGVLGGPATQDVLGINSPFTVHSYDPVGCDRGVRGAWAKLREIRAGAYDVVIDFEQHIVLVALFLRLTGIPCRVGLAAAENPRRRFQTHTIPLSGSERMWEAYSALLEGAIPGLGTPTASALPCSPACRQAIDCWWQAHALSSVRGVIALHLGSGSRAAARRWPVERFVELAEHLRSAGYVDVVLLTGTIAERPLIEMFMASYGGRAIDATGLGSVERTAEVLRRCDLVVSNDTGVMHLAAAMGSATVGLFGPNSPQRYAPVGPRVRVIYTTRLPCSPCIQIHAGSVPECSYPEKGRCLRDIDVATVAHAAIQLLPAVG